MGLGISEQDYLTRSASLGIITGITAAGIFVLVVGWLGGLIVLFISAVITAFVAVAGTQMHFKGDIN